MANEGNGGKRRETEGNGGKRRERKITRRTAAAVWRLLGASLALGAADLHRVVDMFSSCESLQRRAPFGIGLHLRDHVSYLSPAPVIRQGALKHNYFEGAHSRKSTLAVEIARRATCIARFCVLVANVALAQ